VNPELERLSLMFRDFGEVQVPVMSPHYAFLAKRIADDPDLLSIVNVAGRGQPTPNLLFASVRFLLERVRVPNYWRLTRQILGVMFSLNRSSYSGISPRLTGVKSNSS
jgi:hypothetical protein